MPGGPHYSEMNSHSNRTLALTLCLLSLIACSEQHGGNAPMGSTEPAIMDAPAQDAHGTGDEDMSGREAYEEVCARCHETGEGGAPVTGNPSDWKDRSPLWQAVLMEHANAGYFQMPARGGHGEWSERTTNAATQYMLEITFPDRPRD